MQLRDYQQRGYSGIFSAFELHKRIIYCAATGSGKTAVMIHCARESIKAGYTCLILAESKSIWRQVMLAGGGIALNAEASKSTSILPYKLYIGMSQTISRRKNWREAFSNMGNKLLVIVDECHIQTGCKPLLYMPDAFVCGFTATPKAKHLHDYFEHIVEGAQPAYLVKNGWLSPAKHFARRVVTDSDLKVRAGEFTEESMDEAYGKQDLIDGLVSDLSRLKYKKAIVFCPSIKTAQRVSARLCEVNLKNCQVHSLINELESFHLNINICVTVGMLTKGYDFPDIDLVCIYRDTKSLPLFLQMCGRGSRIAEGKSHFSIIDYGGNIGRFGLWEQHREWSIEPPKAKNESDEDIITIPPMLDCQGCGAIILKSEKVCPHCGVVQELEEEEIEHADSELIALNSEYAEIALKKHTDMTGRELAIMAKATGEKMLAQRTARRGGLSLLQEYAKEMGYKQGWAHRYFNHKYN